MKFVEDVKVVLLQIVLKLLKYMMLVLRTVGVKNTLFPL
jgi:hypothetical protein